MEINISEIVIKPGRIRTTFTGIELLAQSIGNPRIGLLHPPVVQKENDKIVLVAGERRLRAMKLLGWTKTVVTLKEELTDYEQGVIELEENIQREDLPWVEKVEAITRLYKLETPRSQQFYKKEGALQPVSAVERVANTLNISVGAVSDAIRLHEAVKNMPLIGKQTNEHKARKLLSTLEAASITVEIMKRHNEKPAEAGLPEIFSVGDCLELIKQLPAKSVDIVVTDPPFGIGIETVSKYGLGAYGRIYHEKDTSGWVLGLLDGLLAELNRVLKDDAIVFMFYGVQHYADVYALFLKHNFNCNEVPAIWVKDQAGQSQRPELWLGACYEPFFVARKGKKLFLRQGRGNVFSFPRLKPHEKAHPFEKPIELLREIISLSALPGDVVLDPFAGTGNSLLAAKAEKCGFYGFEVDETYWAEGKFRLAEKLKET